MRTEKNNMLVHGEKDAFIDEVIVKIKDGSWKQRVKDSLQKQICRGC